MDPYREHDDRSRAPGPQPALEQAESAAPVAAER